MADEVTVVSDEIEAYSDGTVARVRVLAVPTSTKFEAGVKYAFHYGEAGAEHQIIRLDNHHGTHELHLGEDVFGIGFPGTAVIVRCWRAALPEEKRDDWDGV